jgi:hypothetical protein
LASYKLGRGKERKERMGRRREYRKEEGCEEALLLNCTTVGCGRHSQKREVSPWMYCTSADVYILESRYSYLWFNHGTGISPLTETSSGQTVFFSELEFIKLNPIAVLLDLRN